VSDAGRDERFERKGQWRHKVVWVGLLAFTVLSACNRAANPAREFKRAQDDFLHGNLTSAEQRAEVAYRYYSGRDQEWAWKFKLLDANILLGSGNNQKVLSLLDSERPPLSRVDLGLQHKILTGTAYARLHRFDDANRSLGDVAQQCQTTDCALWGELSKARGILQLEREDYEGAERHFETALNYGRLSQDLYLQSCALLDLSAVALQREHFDEAITWSDEATRVAKGIQANVIVEVALGNLGWAHYKTGDSERALELFLEAGGQAKQLGDVVDEVKWLTTSGYVYVDQGKFEVAENLYRNALNLANKISSNEDILNARISLAFVSVLTGKLDLARQYSEQAIASARADGNRVDELYPLLTKGQVFARSGDRRAAEQTFLEVANDPKVDPSLKWKAQHELANLYAEQHEAAKAQAAYRTTLTTFETARSSIQHEDVKLPFLANASSLYDDYVTFLLDQGQVAEALTIADHARARTLSEGLGQLRKTDSALPPALDAQRIARTAGGAVLCYWLGQKQSYLWAITPEKTSLFKLAAASEIDAVVKRYRKALERPREGIESQNQDGLDLYQMLVQPARRAIARSAKLFVISDGSLNGLNFEALLVPDPKPHYWIEDVTIANASSLRLLGSCRQSPRTRGGKLLLVGDPVAPTPEYATPPQAATEIAEVGGHFPAADREVFAQNKATPAAYLGSKPEQFSYIHFVAHGTASRLSPLDSAIVLSRTNAEDDSFRLYARDIIQRPLHADLVTISACYGAGSRAYSGEGLVGLSWAFLRAGAHNVIGALWDVSDASTPLLMDRMYTGIRNGQRPEEALRLAKLSLLHSDHAFRRPFYWAPFQFYTGS
jgi:CHAT domain-containing protein/Flp pilus assembly protein TadD